MGSRTATLVPVEEYLKTVYEPDCDYVDGEVLERNVGEHSHGRVQKKLLLYLARVEERLDIYVIQEQRVQVSPTRYRVPDFCLMLGGAPEEEILTRPPFACIEVLSPEDRASRMQLKIADYLKFGVPYVWVLDPPERRAFVHTNTGMREVTDGVLRTEDPVIEVPLEAGFG
jgi:Uma2 family endonuclease